MGVSMFKVLVFLAVFNVVAITADEPEDEPPFDSSSIQSGAYGSGSLDSSDPSLFDSSDSKSINTRSSDSSAFDTTLEEPSSPPASALSQVGPLLSLLQPVIGGLLNGQGTDTDNAASYPPLLQPLFSPLPFFPGLGIIPSSLAAQASDLIASAAASARSLFANAARENAARSQTNYGYILSAINELNMPLDEAAL